LQPGNYIVEAGDQNLSGIIRHQVHTFYPSEPRNTARVVKVDRGMDTTDIDIVVPDETDHFISGSISSTLPNIDLFRISLKLFDSANSAVVYENDLHLDRQNKSFAIHGIKDGNYELVVLSAASVPTTFAIRSLKVEGSDVSDVKMALEPFASFAGRIQVESPKSATESMTCKRSAEPALGTAMVKADRVTADTETARQFFGTAKFTDADSNGIFRLSNLRRGLYRITVNPDNEDLYVKSISWSGAFDGSPEAPSSEKALDIANDGLRIKPGGDVKDLLVTMASGAASIRGKLISGGERLPKVRINLVPAEVVYANAISRYAEATVSEDGSFVFTNIIPGHYFVTTSNVENADAPGTSWRLAWDSTSRAQLRKAAEARRTSIELRPCDRITDFHVTLDGAETASPNR
jgi:hypothetical protein